VPIRTKKLNDLFRFEAAKSSEKEA